MDHASNGKIADWRTYRRLWVFLRPYAGRLSVVLVISLLSTALGLVQPYISKLLIDDALLKRDMRALVLIASVMFVATVLGFALNILSSYRYVKISAAMLYDMRVALFRHLQSLSPKFYAKFRMGDLMSRLNGDVGEVQRVSADTLLAALTNVLFFVGCVAMMLWLNWRLFFVSVILVPVSLFMFFHYQGKLTAITKQLRERSADLGSLFVDTILGMRVVTSLRAAQHEIDRFKARNDGFVSTMLRMQMTSFMAGALPGTILTAATASVFLYGGWLIFHDQMTIGSLVAFMAYHTRLLSPIQTVMGLISGLASARVSLGRIFELFDTPVDVREAENALPFARFTDSIVFEHVSLRYDREPVLADVSFAIKKGSFCAILGPSGVGKSSIADLMVRYLDPDEGRILLDGRDLHSLRLDDLRREAILVDQMPHLFNDTIAANISFALPDVTRDDIDAAAKAAGLEELVRRLPQGYDTPAGERGLALSAGERQRIALARGLLRKPSIFILDEPTSALDATTEKLVATSLRKILPDATIIVITHKPTLASLADTVITIEAGRAQVSIREPVSAVAV
jgi:ATP-binding cassette subfamily B protein